MKEMNKMISRFFYMGFLTVFLVPLITQNVLAETSCSPENMRKLFTQIQDLGKEASQLNTAGRTLAEQILSRGNAAGGDIQDGINGAQEQLQRAENGCRSGSEAACAQFVRLGEFIASLEYTLQDLRLGTGEAVRTLLARIASISDEISAEQSRAGNFLRSCLANEAR